MSYTFDKYMVANAFLYGATNGYKEFCRNIVYNYSQAYYMPVRNVLSELSIMFMDSEGFEPDEYKKVKIMLKELMEEAKL